MPTVVGVGGRVPPTTVIEDDATGDVETSGSFGPWNTANPDLTPITGEYAFTPRA